MPLNSWWHAFNILFRSTSITVRISQLRLHFCNFIKFYYKGSNLPESFWWLRSPQWFEIPYSCRKIEWSIQKISVKNYLNVVNRHYRWFLEMDQTLTELLCCCKQTVAKMRRKIPKKALQWHHIQKSHKNCVVKSSCLDTQ